MKFTTTLLSALTLATSVLAGTIYSPTANEVVSSPFNFTFDSGRYFKESSSSVTVFLAPNGASYGSNSVTEMKPNTSFPPYSTNGYTGMLSLVPEYGANGTGPYTLTVVETYYAYGGLESTQIYTQDVTFK